MYLLQNIDSSTDNLSTPSQTAVKTSDAYEHKISAPLHPITRNTVFIGTEDGIATFQITLWDLISKSQAGTKVYTAFVPNIGKCIVKWWTEDHRAPYENEIAIYHILENSYIIANLISYGRVVCSSRLADGFVAVIARARGDVLTEEMIERLMDYEQRCVLRRKLLDAIQELRRHNLMQWDARPGNFVWDREREEVTMIDFEVCKARPNMDFDNVGEYEVKRVMGNGYPEV